MKIKVLIPVLFILLSSYVVSQTQLSPCGEIFFMTKNTPANITVNIKAQTDQKVLWHPLTHNLTDLYRTNWLNITGDHLDCNYAFDLSGDCFATYPQLGKNIYKITIENSGKNASIIIDANGCNFVGGDLTLTYDWQLDQFFTGESCGNGVYGTEPINYFLSYNDKSCLELYLTLNSQNGHPYLEWNPYHTTNLGYYVYKKLTSESGTLITKHVPHGTNWADKNFTIGNPRFTNDNVEYWITAKLTSSQESLESNSAKANGTSWIQWKKGIEGSANIINYNLKQNYPNPFNPTTKIDFQIPHNEFIHLNVYNTLGKQVATLVNSKLNVGRYTVSFNASNLPSGIYVYSLQSKNFSTVKKMIVLK